ncbi:MAG: hypothetical protein PHH47_11580 [Gallionella sp.]|nr:hypothetical protein [Gallionella sp.]MDD4947388.1 hypothetical protein [Gallionella sp.]MDD5613096.1 hypothetical protein [Gallionella sp.]
MKQQIKKSQKLINLIRSEVANRGESLVDLAKYLDISYIHMTSLTGGARDWAGLKQHKQRRLAAYLGISLVELYRLSGILLENDFYPAAFQLNRAGNMQFLPA